MDAAQDVFDQTLQDEENGRKPVGVRLELAAIAQLTRFPMG